MRRCAYYAHLDALVPEVRVGRRVRAGEALGRVGATGNARGGPPHLHFAIYAWQRGAVDPHPLLVAGPAAPPCDGRTATRRPMRRPSRALAPG